MCRPGLQIWCRTIADIHLRSICRHLDSREPLSHIESDNGSEHAAARPECEKLARVLVVDDIEGNRSLVSRLLSAEGYSVSVAEDGRDALQSVRREPPD